LPKRSRKPNATAETTETKTGRISVAPRNAAGALPKTATMSSRRRKAIAPRPVVVSPPSGARPKRAIAPHGGGHRAPPGVRRAGLQLATTARLVDDRRLGSHPCAGDLQRGALSATDLGLHDGPIILPNATTTAAIETVLAGTTSILKKKFRLLLLETKRKRPSLVCRRN